MFHRRGAGWLLVGLVLLADFLFWRHDPGVSLALFGLVLGLLILWHRPMPVARRAFGIAGLLLCLLPMVEMYQTLSLMFWLIGLGFAVGLAAQHQPPFGMVWQAALRFAFGSLPQVVRDLVAAGRGLAAAGRGIDGGLAQGFVRLWGLPLAVGGVFALLLVAGNPVLDGVLQQLQLPEPQVDRIFFWAGMAALVWPFLAIGRMTLNRPFSGPAWPAATGAGVVNPGSVLRALWLFNALFAVQTATDSLYLWGGATLPAGISYAEYAHRGAYPLIVTALLAGLFAMLARPWATGVIRVLLLVWIGQNLMLVVSSIYRLDLYVDQFGLTRLRVAAFVWMVMVAIGLGLTLFQLFRSRSNGWLIRASAALLAVMLYAMSLVNVDGAIARYNLDMNRNPQQVQRLDNVYLCSLGYGALPAIAAFEAQHALTLCPWGGPVLPVQDWREWGFRAWRIQRYLEAEGGAAWQARAF